MIYRNSIKNKVTLMVFLSVLTIVVVGLGLGSYFNIKLLHKTIGQNNFKIAQLFSEVVSGIFEERIEALEIYMSHSSRKAGILKNNAKYTGMDEAALKDYFSRMDKEWTEASDDSLLIREYLDSSVSERLKAIVEKDLDLAEMFITDRFGGLVASSGRTSDFYQADEKWWEEAFDGGKGKILIGDVEYDESSKTPSLPLIVPVRAESGEVIGISKTMLDIKFLFRSLEKFRVGKTGHVVLVNRHGYMLFHEDVEPLKEKIVNEIIFQKLIESEQQWVIENNPVNHKRRLSIAYANIHHPLFEEGEGGWRVCVVQDATEVLVPLKNLFSQFVVIVFILLMVAGVVAFKTSSRFVKPIKKLHEATIKIGEGNLDYKAEIKTGDEIEDLADSFNNMVKDLKITTTSIEKLNKEIRERKRAEMNINKAAEVWQRTFDSITDLVFIQDIDSNIVKANKAFVTAMKAKPEDIIGKKCYQVVHGGDSSWPECPFQAMLKDGKACSKEIDDPKIGIPLLVMVSPIFDEEGKIIGAVHIAKDITEHKKVEKLKDEFVSTVSHELRTPLSIIKEGVSLVMDEIPGKLNLKQKRILKMSGDNIDRLARMINNLLDISKIEAGKIKLDKSIVDIGKILKNISKEWKLESSKKAQKINCSVPNVPVNIFIDFDKITQALDNLISNAIKYTPDKGQIKIELINMEDNIKIIISDTGQGISKENLPKAFNKFQQFGRVSGPGTKGTGLGLAITKSLIEEHGGTIRIKSELNKGTQFIISLPKLVKV